MSFSGGYSYARIVRLPNHSDLLHGAHKMLGSFYNVLKSVLRLAKSLTWDVLRHDRLQYPFFQNFLYEVSFQQVAYLGYLIGLGPLGNWRGEK